MGQRRGEPQNRWHFRSAYFVSYIIRRASANKQGADFVALTLLALEQEPICVGQQRMSTKEGVQQGVVPSNDQEEMQSTAEDTNIDDTGMEDARNTITDKELSECDREDLSHIGLIQGGCGHVLFIKNPSGEVVGHDDDICEVEFIKPATAKDKKGDVNMKNVSLIGVYLKDLIPASLCTTIMSCVEQMRVAMSHRTFHFYSVPGQTFALSISSPDEDYTVVSIEIEVSADSHESADSFCSTLVHLGRIMEFYANDTLASTACDAVFHVMQNYDRGMVYKFNDDLSGEIIHEITNGALTTSYMGMRFPKSDIPLPARQLYITNGLRYIHDIEEDNIAVHALAGAASMDLAQIRMRACARPHIIYLRNMGVRSSLSIAIVVNDQLWGLLAFHGYKKPYKPSLHQRIACETISKMVSVRIEAMEKKNESSRILEMGDVLMNLSSEMTLSENFKRVGEKSLLQILDCDVIVVHVQDRMGDDDADGICIGDEALRPSPKFWKKFATYENRKIFANTERQHLLNMGLTEEDCPPCGVLFFREGRTQVMLGRAVRSRDVRWAGNPDMPKLRIGGILNPRASFETFMEKARLESRAWSSQDLTVVAAFRDRVCEHCHNLMMGQLKHAITDTNKKYMAAIDGAKDNYEFFARMSHELRTPFHGVMGCLDILDQSYDTMQIDEVRDILRTAKASGAHMLALLNDILNIAKQKYLPHSFTRDRVSYQALAYDAIDCMKTLAATRNLAFSFEVQPKGEDNEQVMIVTDRTKIIQVVSNLVNNAIKFTHEGSIRVSFNLASTMQQGVDMWTSLCSGYEGSVFTMKEGEMLDDIEEVQRKAKMYPNFADKRWLLVSVIDSGCGMVTADLAKMFAPYTQASSGSNRSFQGTGLGLFICVSLCVQLSGFIACASTPDKGTVFYFGVPVEVVKQGDALCPTSTDIAFSSDTIVLKGPVLIVDDNAVNIKILKRQVERLLKIHKVEVEVITANSAEEGLEAYKNLRPGLCFIDYHMPGKDGVETTKDIRAYEESNGLDASHILCYTADGTDRAKRLVEEAGCNEIMYKPPPKGFLENLIKRIEYRGTELFRKR